MIKAKERFTLFSNSAAEEIGVNGAIILGHIAYWVDYNATKDNSEDYFHEGCYWTYETLDEFKKRLTYFSLQQIRTALSKLEQGGYIKKGDYNANRYNRRKWYTLTDKGWALQLGENTQHDLLNSTNVHALNATNANVASNKTTIQYNSLTYKDNIKGGGKPARPFEGIPVGSPLREALDGFAEMRKKIRAPLTPRAEKMALEKLDKLAPGDTRKQVQIIDQSTLNSWRGLFPLKTDSGGRHEQSPMEMADEMIREMEAKDDGRDGGKNQGHYEDDSGLSGAIPFG